MSDELYFMAVGAVIGAAAILFVRKRRSKNKEVIPQTDTGSEIEALEKDISKLEQAVAEQEQIVKAHEEQIRLAEAAINKPPFEHYMNMYAKYSTSPAIVYADEIVASNEEEDADIYDDGPGEYEANPDPKDHPYAIVDDRLGEYGYEKIQLYLLMPSKKLVDADFELVENVPLWVGSDFLDHISLEEGGGILRNDKLKCDFNIECLWRSYDDVALMRPNPPVYLDE